MNAQKFKKQCTMAYGFSSARLVMNYFMLEDSLLEDAHPVILDELITDLRDCLKSYLAGGLPLEKAEELRLKVTDEAKIITAYTDCFQIYEYVLNRVERKYLAQQPVIDETGIVEELMSFIAGGKDTVVVNARIQQVIGQLPVRFTRRKFYAMVREALSIYIGSERSSLDRLMYLLRSSAMMDLPADMERGYEDLLEIMGQFENLDMKNLDASGYREAEQKVSFACERLRQSLSCYLVFQEVVNDFYVLLLTREQAVTDLAEVKTVTTILEKVLSRTENHGSEEWEEELMADFLQLEGMQEAYYEKYQRVAPSEEELKSEDGKEVQISRKLELLLSGSPFVDLKDQAADEEVVDVPFLDQTAEAFFQELDKLFERSQKPLVRAVMAKILSELPVCFNQFREVETYITGSLSSCADPVEKEACIDLLRQLMESENALV